MAVEGQESALGCPQGQKTSPEVTVGQGLGGKHWGTTAPGFGWKHGDVSEGAAAGFK